MYVVPVCCALQEARSRERTCLPLSVMLLQIVHGVSGREAPRSAMMNAPTSRVEDTGRRFEQ